MYLVNKFNIHQIINIINYYIVMYYSHLQIIYKQKQLQI